jgi:hypothetical protein
LNILQEGIEKIVKHMGLHLTFPDAKSGWLIQFQLFSLDNFGNVYLSVEI